MKTWEQAWEETNGAAMPDMFAASGIANAKWGFEAGWEARGARYRLALQTANHDLRVLRVEHDTRTAQLDEARAALARVEAELENSQAERATSNRIIDRLNSELAKVTAERDSAQSGYMCLEFVEQALCAYLDEHRARIEPGSMRVNAPTVNEMQRREAVRNGIAAMEAEAADPAPLEVIPSQAERLRQAGKP